MALGADTQVVNGQQITTPSHWAYVPTSFGPQTVGVPQVTPSYPPYVGGTTGGAAPGAENVGGYGTAGANSTATFFANQNPWSFKGSPVIFAVAGLLISLILLKAIHWRETILEGEEHANLGPIGERAEASA